MAAVIGGIGISHTPSMGLEYDRGTASPDGFSPRWQPWYDGTRRVEELLERLAPDHLVVVYNDHLNHFDLDNYPTLAIGVGARFRQADEGWGPRDLPDLEGDTRWGAVYTFQTFPAITGCGALVMAEPGALPGTGSGSEAGA